MRDRYPLLTVVVPAYRVEAYLPRCLDSILAEAADDLEVLVVDDRSPDGSGALADAYARHDPRVRALHLALNLGLGRARNLGIDHARGEYLWFVDGDDWLPAGAVGAVRQRLTVLRPDLLVVDHAVVSADGEVTPGAPPGALATDRTGPLADHPGLLRLAHSACTKVVRRGFLDDIGLRFHAGWYEDAAFSQPLLLAASRIATLDEVCYYYRQRDDGGITRSVGPRHFDVFAQYERMWRAARRTGDVYQRFQSDLFRSMVDHLLVIAGNPCRLPPTLRRDFFHRAARAYRRWQPPDGYRAPGGLDGLKHRLVRRDAYGLYSALRLARGTARRLRRWPTGTAGHMPRRPRAGVHARSAAAQRTVDRGNVRQVEPLPAGEVGVTGAQLPHPPG